MKKIKDIFNLYINSKSKATEENQFAQWLLDSHDSDEKDQEMEELWKNTSTDLSSVYSAKRKVDSVIFPERSVIRKYRFALAGACAVAASFAVALLLTYVMPSTDSHPEYAEVNTLSGENKEVLLSDGTKVVLNSYSKLIFPETFSGDRREVFLTGEAVFDVAEDEDMPFVVSVSGYDIEVLGTVFNVADYKDEHKYTLALKEGHVKVNIPDSAPIYLIENQGIVYDKTSNAAKKVAVNAGAVMAWTDGIMYFDGADIYEIIKMAERSFGVKIICSDQSKYTNARITARFDTSGDITDLLDVLEKLIPDMSYTQSDSVIYLK